MGSFHICFRDDALRKSHSPSLSPDIDYFKYFFVFRRRGNCEEDYSSRSELRSAESAVFFDEFLFGAIAHFGIFFWIEAVGLGDEVSYRFTVRVTHASWDPPFGGSSLWPTVGPILRIVFFDFLWLDICAQAHRYRCTEFNCTWSASVTTQYLHCKELKAQHFPTLFWTHTIWLYDGTF